MSSSRGKGRRPSKLIKLLSANQATEIERYKDRFCVCCLLELEDMENLSIAGIEKNLLTKRKKLHHFSDHSRKHGFEQCKKSKKKDGRNGDIPKTGYNESYRVNEQRYLNESEKVLLRNF